jgi:hypothetical protein
LSKAISLAHEDGRTGLHEAAFQQNSRLRPWFDLSLDHRNTLPRIAKKINAPV